MRKTKLNLNHRYNNYKVKFNHTPLIKKASRLKLDTFQQEMSEYRVTFFFHHFKKLN